LESEVEKSLIYFLQTGSSGSSGQEGPAEEDPNHHPPGYPNLNLYDHPYPAGSNVNVMQLFSLSPGMGEII
jgi:hypothetical protein